MNSLKSIVATMTLLAIGYGSNFFMNQPVSLPDAENAWDMVGQLRADRIPNQRPQVDLPPLQPAIGVSSTNSGPGANVQVANPFSQGADPSLPGNFAPPANDSFASLPPINSGSQPPPASPFPAPAPANAGFSSTPNTGLPEIPQPFPANVPPPVAVANTATPNPGSIYGSNPVAVPPANVAPPAVFTPPPQATTLIPSVPASMPQPIVPPVSQFDAGVQPATFTQPAAQSVSNVDFDGLWNSAQAKLTAGDMEGASTTLTQLYRQTLSSQDRDRVVTILDQLAGTTIYSSEHFLLPAHSVAANETLATIAQAYGIPPEFLARSNGLATNASLSVGQQLKVVKGPFHGELDLGRREMTIFLGPHYAGRFNVAIGRDFPVGVSAFVVNEKSGPRAYQDSRTGQSIAAGDPGNPVGAYWLGLQSQPAVNALNVGIHSVGEGVTASDSRGCISVSQADAADLQAIFSVGSQITVIGTAGR